MESGDNRIFNVNGVSKDFFMEALDLAIRQSGYKPTSWSIHHTKGFVLHWAPLDNTFSNSNYTPFPSHLSSKSIGNIIWEWMHEETQIKIHLDSEWDVDTDHDGDNGDGWRIYCEDWGNIDECGDYAFIAILPVYIWYGK